MWWTRSNLQLQRLICILPFIKANRHAEALLKCLSSLTSSLLLGSLTVNMKETNIFGLFTVCNFSKKDSYVKIFMNMFFLILTTNYWMVSDKNKLPALCRGTKTLWNTQEHIQGVPLATEPSISLIILIPMKILQRNLSRSTFVLLEMKRNVSVVCVCFVAIFSLVGSEWDTLYKISKY